MILQFKGLPQWLHKIRLASSHLLRARKVSAFFVFGGFFLNLASWALLAWLAKTEQSVVILHYNAFMGIDAIADFDVRKDYFQIFLAPIGGAFVFFLNLAIAHVLCAQSEFFGSSGNGSGLSGEKIPRRATDNSKVCRDSVGMLGAYLVLAGSLALQSAVFLYTIAIIWVNR